MKARYHRKNNMREVAREIFSHFYLFTFSLFLFSCTTENYETGDGDMSYMRADFVMMHTAAAKTVDHFVTDEGETVNLQTQATVSWAEKADTLYRALAYYNNDKAAQKVEVKSLQPVYVLRPRKVEDLETEPKDDPVGLESAWMSSNGQFINLGILLMMGQPEDDKAHHIIGVVLNSETDDTITLTFDHDQGGIPEYYTQRYYVSIPVTDTMQGKAVTLRLNTYQGLIEKTFSL
ncbi:MAG: NigD-like N-terminal domain-containing protein [Prevotella sp.]|nr:NigD-like N-terminal domain-containing protein [Prevotella sp.]